MDRSNGNRLQSCSDWHTQETYDDTEDPLGQCEWCCACKRSQELNDYDLKENRCTDHNHKDVIVQYSFENIDLFHLSRAYLVKHLEFSEPKLCQESIKNLSF